MRVPVHFVSGANAPQWASRAQSVRPGWRVLQSPGCPCCTGRVVLQVTLVRLLRERRPSGVLVVLPDATHHPSAQAALGEAPLSRHVVAGRLLLLPQDEHLALESLERA